MTPSSTRFNPFPGLRAFDADEDHLFFGRETKIDELLRRLRSRHFLAVVGSSGCGKSSLVRCGLIPALHSGFLVSAGSSWRVALLHPGEDPIGNLARALNAPTVLGTDDPEAASRNEMLLNVTLRRGARGVIDAVRQAKTPIEENLLIIVDQFEELFRFRHSRSIADSRDEAIAFVKLLIEVGSQTDLPVYVVLTMRSDFLGDCMEYPGLPEAVNDGQFLVPRMTRDELRLAITGPVAVGGGNIAPRLVQRLLNEFGDDPDQLPVLQHALMRTWDYWERAAQTDRPIDIDDYEAVGTMRNALSLHAEEAYSETGSERARIAERIFKALTDTFSDPRGVRRPATVQALAAISEVSEADVIDVVDVFRQPRRTFLTPPSTVTITSASIIDLAHESLMRRWERLIQWTKEESAAAAFYGRLSRAAAWFEQGVGALWRNPELELAARWRQESSPTPAWASRYDDSFERAMSFLYRSHEVWDRAQAEQEQERSRRLRRARMAAAVFGVLFVAAVALGFFFVQAQRSAGRSRALAEQATASLSAAGFDLESPGKADSADLQAFKAKLLGQARDLYVKLETQGNSEGARREAAHRDLELAHIYRTMNSPDAPGQYARAIEDFQQLRHDSRSSEDRHSLAAAYNWLGETLREGQPAGYQEAASNYELALATLRELQGEDPSHAATYKQEYARAIYNRGLLRSQMAESGNHDQREKEALFDEAETDLRDAVSLLDSLQAAEPNAALLVDVARACNNLGNLMFRRYDSFDQLAKAQAFFERAAVIERQLLTADPANREYALELLQIENGLGSLLRHLNQSDQGLQAARAVRVVDDMLRQRPLVGLESVKAHVLLGEASSSSSKALDEYRQAAVILRQVASGWKAEDWAVFESQSFGPWFETFLEDLKGLPAGGKATLVADLQQAIIGLDGVLKGMPPAEAARFNHAIQQLKKTVTELVRK